MGRRTLMSGRDVLERVASAGDLSGGRPSGGREPRALAGGVTLTFVFAGTIIDVLFYDFAAAEDIPVSVKSDP